VREGELLEVAGGIESRPPLAADPSVGVCVIDADALVVVIDKPAGLVVHPGAGHDRGTLVHGLLARFPDMATQDWPDPERPGVLHRLDKLTSGLLLVARTPAALAALGAQLRARTLIREYDVLVWGHVVENEGLIDAPLGRSVTEPTKMAVRAEGRPAVTRYRVVRRFEDAVTLLRCRLETGRTHQIRVHLATIGHPVVGDPRYARGRQGLLRGRPFLHAGMLSFRHPAVGESRTYSSPLPAELKELLDRLA